MDLDRSAEGGPDGQEEKTLADGARYVGDNPQEFRPAQSRRA